jgi:hypothetical protein
MGAGLGHTKRLMMVATALREEGFEPVLAQRDIRTLADKVRSADIPVVPTPHINSLAPKNKPFRALTYADIMAIAGYADEIVLRAMLDAWDGLLRYIKPSIVIGDYCPVLPLATRGRIPFLAFGDGFVVPPHEVAEFPQLRAKGEAIKAASLMTEDANRILKERKQSLVEHLGQIVAGDAQIICTFPELDIYHANRSEPANGPLSELPEMRQPPRASHLFVYLAADYKQTRKVLRTVIDSGVSVEGFVRDAPSPLREALRRGGMLLHDQPPNLADRLTNASVIMHHGGIGTMETALAMGCPQLLLTRHLEQGLNARNLKQQKVVRILNPDDTEKLPRMIQNALEDRAWQDLAQKLARNLNARRPLSCIEQLVATVKALAS